MSDQEPECYGVQCKNQPNCGIHIAFGVYEVETDPVVHKAKRLANPTKVCCPNCRKEYEYDLADLIHFPCPEYWHWVSF